MANAGLTVRISPNAEPRHLRDMAQALIEEANKMEGKV